MSKITIDANLGDRLRNVLQPVELCDPSGQVLGRFTPTAHLAGVCSGPQLSEEELQRREQEPDYSTAEVLAQLEKR